MVLSCFGAPLERGRPDYTEDGRFWDGDRFFWPSDTNVRNGQAAALTSVTAAIEIPMNCCADDPRCSSKWPVSLVGLKRLQQAGFVRFRQPEGRLELWAAEDGALLALLVGEVGRPALG